MVGDGVRAHPQARGKVIKVQCPRLAEEGKHGMPALMDFHGESPTIECCDTLSVSNKRSKAIIAPLKELVNK